MAVHDKNFLPWTQLVKSDPKCNDPNKYCQYHQLTYSHDMNNCFQLMNENERLVNRGHLENFIKKDKGSSSRPEERKEPIRKRSA